MVKDGSNIIQNVIILCSKGGQKFDMLKMGSKCVHHVQNQKCSKQVNSTLKSSLWIYFTCHKPDEPNTLDVAMDMTVD